VKIKDGELSAGGNVTLLSNEVKSASIFEIENAGIISGDIKVQLYIAPDGEVYHDLSMPVSDVTVADLQQYFPITGNFSGASTGPGLTADPSMFTYNTVSSMPAPFPPAGTSNTATLQRGAGYSTFLYAVNGTTPTSAEVNGNPFQGNISYTLTEGSGGSANDGWNLIGNPYASFIIWNDIDWIRSGVSNSIAI